MSAPKKHKLEDDEYMISPVYSPSTSMVGPPCSGLENKYLSRTLAHVLPDCLKEICQVRPEDPVEYLAHSLYTAADAEVEFYKKQIELTEQEIARKEQLLESTARSLNVQKLCAEIENLRLQLARLKQKKESLPAHSSQRRYS
ncbi:uncharacterized protein LOC131950289 [Physella acuta]|uniref:uncharacterized protein LOC131950289 n=1 Tax=Physella acuta TaxID=109671 RepID=UPI0027DB59D1|nr:uncharacterized protein LOC131950289 [Physella acuta]